MAFSTGAMAVDEKTVPPLLINGPEKAAQIKYQTMDNGKLLISVTDAKEAPVMGLTPMDFSIKQGMKTAKILSVEPLATAKDVPLNIVMVIDNSRSMEQRKAIGPLKSALDAFYDTLRPIDRVTAVVFDEKQTRSVSGHALHVDVYETSQVDQLRSFIGNRLDKGLTDGTYLHDAMLAGLDIAGQMPDTSNKFMVVFSDGEDINSTASESDVEGAAKSIANLSAYAVDYMPTAAMNPFLEKFSTKNNGHVWKAASATDLLPVFKAFSSTLLHRYVVSYRFLEGPTGTLAFSDPQLTIEEVTTIDSAPLLNHIYFETGESDLSQRYSKFGNQTETAGFNEKQLKDAMEKYRNVLNIIGSRMKANPDATIRLVGCNANVGVEKGRSDLSKSRAEAVRAYLHYVWGIDNNRLALETRDLPEAPSSIRIEEGQAENRRVEIYASNDAILDTVDSAYIQKVSNLNELRIRPDIKAEAGIDDWQVDIVCSDREIKSLKGQGALPGQWTVPLEGALLDDMSNCKEVEIQMQATDKEANELLTQDTTPLPVKYIQRTEQMAQIDGYRVMEKYALILFDFNSADIKARNKAIVDRIISRMDEIPDAEVIVTGHTDSIGSEDYNLTLSDRRAQTVRDILVAAKPGISERLQVKGVGPNSPLYDNALPEGRALNRTVTVTLTYQQK